MALGVGYEQQECHLARALEVVGERWTLLIVRDCFYGVRRFTDFRDHLQISRAVLTDRLDSLVAAGVLTRAAAGARSEYLLTEAGRALWPVVFGLIRWGRRYTAGDHPARVFCHAPCGTELDDVGQCPTCGTVPAPDAIEARPGSDASAPPHDDFVSRVLMRPHRLLTPVRAETGAEAVPDPASAGPRIGTAMR